MKRRKKKKKSLKKIMIHEEQLHQLLLKIDDKETLRSPDISPLHGEGDLVSFFNTYQHIVLTPIFPNVDTESLEILRDTSGDLVKKNWNIN